MTHRNAALSIEGRRHLLQRCQTLPIAHVAAEMGISPQCASKWVNRHRRFGELGLADRSSTPHHQPQATSAEVTNRIEKMRRNKKWSARRISHELCCDSVDIAVRTVTRQLQNLVLNRRRFIDPTGENIRPPRQVVAQWPGQMVHVDVKKVRRNPDGSGWRALGRGSAKAKLAASTKKRGAKTGYVYLHSAVDGFSRLAYTEALDNETAITAIGFMDRARAFFGAHGIVFLERIVTDNGSCYPAADFAKAVRVARHQRIRPYTPRHNGKVERYNRILAEEFLYAREWTSEHQRAHALGVWNIHYNYHRPHSAAGNRPPASRLRAGVTNVMASYT
ncbi:IS481 family transposase [Nocardia sp. NPDC057272]|uniref:IS481 family transposase n=1 Tax=Nocardia sp. NPDC057272 TaxID=3346079 RepID=UPI00363E61F2